MAAISAAVSLTLFDGERLRETAELMTELLDPLPGLLGVSDWHVIAAARLIVWRASRDDPMRIEGCGSSEGSREAARPGRAGAMRLLLA